MLGIKKTVNKSVVCQNSDRKVANRDMGLPVARIMEEVEHELLHMNDELLHMNDELSISRWRRRRMITWRMSWTASLWRS